jgi:hypothetical protein
MLPSVKPSPVVELTVEEVVVVQGYEPKSE